MSNISLNRKPEGSALRQRFFFLISFKEERQISYIYNKFVGNHKLLAYKMPRNTFCAS